MGKQITITSQKYFNEFKNDTDFTANLGDYTNNFTGNVMENVKVSLTMRVEWFSQASAVSQFTVSGGIVYFDSFIDDGFSIGDTVTFQKIDSSGTILSSHTATVSSISNTVMVTGGFTPAIGDGLYSASIIRGTTPLTALIHKYSLRENSANFGVQNLVTGNDSAYYGSGMTIGGGFVNFQSLGQVKDWVDGTFKCEKLANPSTFVQEFEIEHELLIPFYEEGQDLSLLPQYLDGLKSLKYVFASGFRTVLSDPNTEKNFEYDLQLGSVGGYDENYNGFNNNYEIVSTDYVETATGNPADGLIIGSKTTATIVVKKLSGVFTGSDRFGSYVSYQAEQIDYTNTTTDFKSNFIYDRALSSVGMVANAGDDFITSNSATIVSGDMVIVVDVDYTNAQKLFLSNKFAQNPIDFIIGVSVGDNTIPSGNSDRVMLLADTGVFDESADIPDLIQNTVFEYFPYNKEVGVDTGFTGLTQWNEDGITINGSFDLDLSKNAFLNSFQMELTAFNTVTEGRFILDNYNFDLTNTVVVSGVQQINVVTDRGYNLENGSQFNEIELTTGNLIGDLQGYNLRFSQKISWQDWINNNLVDTIFYDNTKPNNNLNDKSSNYSNLNDYEIGVSIFANVSGVNEFGVSGLTNYLITSPNITVYDYDLDDNITPIWSGVIETFNNSNMSNLGGAILTGSDDTLFRVTWTSTGGAVTDLTGFTAIHRIEETNQNGFAIDEIGTLYSYPNGNRVIPKGGYTNLDMYIDTGNVITECLIKGNTLNSGTPYNISARIDIESLIDPKAKLTSPDNTPKDTSGTVETKITAP